MQCVRFFDSSSPYAIIKKKKLRGRVRFAAGYCEFDQAVYPFVGWFDCYGLWSGLLH